MPVLVWDAVGSRQYETGLDKGVLYLPDGSAVAWNGLTAIIESFNKEVSPVYYDGMKINDLVVLGDFAATMKAVTYPDEFLEIEGIAGDRCGLFYSDQPPQTFGLCYRTQVGNDLDGDVEGYKIHILFNVTAIPSDKTYASLTAEPSLVEFEWNITAVPEEVPGHRPTAHMILDSRDFDPMLLEDLEAMFYGTSVADAALIPMQELLVFINTWYRVKITDNLDGTWTAETLRDGFINFGANGFFEIVDVNAIYLNDTTFEVSDTVDVCDVDQLSITDFGNGTWSATTAHDGLIVMTTPTEFQILNANVVWLNDYTYQISDTEE